MTSKFTKDIKEIKKTQKTYMAMQRSILARVKRLEKAAEKYISKRWKETFGVEVDFVVCVDYGCLSDQWNATAYFDGLDNLDHYKGAFYRVDMSDDLTEYDGYKCTVTKVKSPVSIKNFRKFLNDMEKETGIHCYINSSFLVQKYK